MHDEPILGVAHLGHLEVLTPKPEQSLGFFVELLGMTESGRQGESVCLRAWDDYERYSLKLTGSKTSGLGHAAFRARSPQALERRVKALQGSGLELGWHEGELGHGPAYQIHDPDGHLIAL
jgi:catechol 2,3-dioxygenase